MPKEKLTVDASTSTMLANIHRGVAIILWVVLTHALVWPIGSAISGARDEALLSYGVMTWAVPISMVVSFVVTRFVFPLSYVSENHNTSAPSQDSVS